MEIASNILVIVLYSLGAIALIGLIILTFKLIKTVDKVNRIADNVEGKVSSLDGMFSIIDVVTDKLATLNDFLVDKIVDFIGMIFNRRKNKKEEVEEDEE